MTKKKTERERKRHEERKGERKETHKEELTEPRLAQFADVIVNNFSRGNRASTRASYLLLSQHADSKQPISRGTPIDASIGLSRDFSRIMKMTRDELAEADNQ